VDAIETNTFILVDSK